MPDQVFDTPEVTKLIKKSKGSEMQMRFAFGLAAKPEECGLILDMRKAGKALRDQIKAAPGIKKTCYGVLIVKENDVLITPETPLKGIVKQLKKRFRAEGLGKYNPILLDAEGNLIDEDTLPDEDYFAVDDTDNQAPVGREETQQAGSAEQAEDAALLKKRLGLVAQSIKTLADQSLAGKLAPGLKTAVQLLAAGELSDCDTLLGKLEKAIARVESAEVATPKSSAELEEKLKKALATIVAQIKTFPAEQSGDLVAKARAISSDLQSKKFNEAASGIKVLSQELQSIGKSSTTASDPMKIWQDAKESVDEGISKLQATLKGVDHPVLTKIADSGLAGVTDGNNTALMKALFEMKSATGDARTKAGKALLTQVANYLMFIKDDPVIDLIENNPFGVAVPIKTRLTAALRDIADIAKAA